MSNLLRGHIEIVSKDFFYRPITDLRIFRHDLDDYRSDNSVNHVTGGGRVYRNGYTYDDYQGDPWKGWRG